jgi:hypothetical protein
MWWPAGSKKSPVAEGASEDLAEARDFSGGAWSATAGGTILFGTSKGISRVSAEGGSATVITELGQGETGHFWPSFLPDGTRFTYVAWSEDAATRAVYAGTLDTKDKQKLMAEESNAVYAASTGSRQAPGFLFFHRGPTFSRSPLTQTRGPSRVNRAGGSVAIGQTGAACSMSPQAGALIYFQGSGGAGRGIANAQFRFVDRTGGRVEMASNRNLGDMDIAQPLIAVTKTSARNFRHLGG